MAVINTKEVLTKCNDGIRIVEELQKQFAERQEQLKAQEESIQKLRQNPAVSDPKSGKREELQTLVQKLMEDSQKLRQDVGDVEAVKFKPVVDKVNKALAAYAKEHGLVSVQDKTGFAYIDPSIDITDAIIKQVDETK
jgi:outer membrane protein